MTVCNHVFKFKGTRLLAGEWFVFMLLEVNMIGDADFVYWSE